MSKHTEKQFCLTLLCLFCFAVPSQAQFWKKDSGWQRRMEFQKQIYVSAHASEVNPGVKRFDLESSGVIAAPSDFVFKEIQHFENLPKASDHFKKAVWNKEKNELYLLIEALQYEARLVMKMDITKDNINWLVIDGPFTGMKGAIEIVSFKRQKTQISMKAYYEAPELPLPKILMGFTLEIIAEKIAKRLRTFIEEQYKNDLRI